MVSANPNMRIARLSLLAIRRIIRVLGAPIPHDYPGFHYEA